MKFPWQRTATENACIERQYLDNGIQFVRPASTSDWSDLEHFSPSLKPAAAYIQQLINERHIAETSDGALLPWANLYEVVADESHAGSLPLLALPADSAWRPELRSHRTPSDPDFSLAVQSWISPTRASEVLDRRGGVLTNSRETWLVSQPVWQLCEAVDSQAGLAPQLSSAERLHELGKILALAKRADATLDDYLRRTRIASPEKISLDLQQHTALGVPVVELIPHPERTPREFVKAFDQYDSVRDRYDVTQSDGGMLHVSPSHAVKDVLASIKKLPGRRLASDEARLFIHNPFAVLGESAKALDEDQLIEAREKAALLSSELEFISTDDPSQPILRVVSASESDSGSSTVLTSAITAELLDASARARSRGLNLFVWDGNEISLTARTQTALSDVANWVGWQSIRALAFDEIMCLDAYSDRVTGFGERMQTVLTWPSERPNADGSLTTFRPASRWWIAQRERFDTFLCPQTMWMPCGTMFPMQKQQDRRASNYLEAILM